jgi:hypothetical protein
MGNFRMIDNRQVPVAYGVRLGRACGTVISKTYGGAVELGGCCVAGRAQRLFEMSFGTQITWGLLDFASLY